MADEARREPLSVCIVCCNEAENIVDCLQSVRWADEIVVVDSGSADATVELAQGLTDRVVHHDWEGYVRQKNYALGLASHEWVLCIDADERVSPELAQEIQNELARIAAGEPRAVGFTMPRKVRYFGRWILHGGWYPDRKLRFFRKSAGSWGGVDPHDHLRVDGKVAALKGDLLHFSFRDMRDHLDTINNFTSVAAREKQAGGRKHALLHMLLNPPIRFLRMYVLKRGFLDGMPGFICAVLGSYYVFLKYAKLWELEREGSHNPPEATPPAEPRE